MTPLPDTERLLLDATADLLHPEDARTLRGLLRRLERGDPPLATDRERRLLQLLPNALAVTLGADELRTRAAQTLAQRIGVALSAIPSPPPSPPARSASTGRSRSHRSP